MKTRLSLGLVLACCLLMPLRASAQDVTEYYGVDALGSVRVVFDSAGNLVNRMDYGPFGEQLAGSTFSRRVYAQLFRDGETGQDYAEARMYQSRTGRFGAPDSAYAGLSQPQAWNRYSYALNNPLSFVDPTGLMAENCSTTEEWIVTNEKTGAGYLGVETKCKNKPDDSGGGAGASLWGDIWWELNQWFDRLTLAERTGSTVPGEDEIVPTGRYTPSQTMQQIDKVTLVAAIVAPVIAKAAGAVASVEAEAATKAAVADHGFHYTFSRAIASIEANGLRSGSYATPNGTLSPLQAHIDLALPPNRGLPDSLVRIDLTGMRQAGYEIPSVNQVGRSFNMPGGGYEIRFPYPVPSQFLTVIRR